MSTPPQRRRFPSLPDASTYAQEVNILGLEGRLFDFRRKHKDGATSLTFNDHREQTVKFKFDPEYGRPGSESFRALQAIFRKITEEGFPVVCQLAFGQRELARLAGMSEGGHNLKNLYIALKQLSNTTIVCEFYDKAGKIHHELEFRILTKAYYARNEEGALTSCALWVEPLIAQSMNDDYWTLFNWSRIEGLDPVTMTMAKRLTWYFSIQAHEALRDFDRRPAGSPSFEAARKRLTVLGYEKDLEDLFAEWLGGLQAPRFAADFRRKQGDRMEALKESGIIKAWTIGKAKNGKLKLGFRPGDGFIADYLGFWHTKHQPAMKFIAASDAATISEPLELVALFFRTLSSQAKLDSDQFLDKDRLFASELIASYGRPAAEQFATYAAERARKEHYAVLTFVGVKAYVQAWLAEQDRQQRTEQDRKARSAKARAEQDKLHQERQQDDYDRWRRSELRRLFAELPEAEQVRLTAIGNQQLEGQTFISVSMRATFLGFQIDALVADSHPLPSFEDWLARK